MAEAKPYRILNKAYLLILFSGDKSVAFQKTLRSTLTCGNAVNNLLRNSSVESVHAE